MAIHGGGKTERNGSKLSHYIDRLLMNDSEQWRAASSKIDLMSAEVFHLRRHSNNLDQPRAHSDDPACCGGRSDAGIEFVPHIESAADPLAPALPANRADGIQQRHGVRK